MTVIILSYRNVAGIYPTLRSVLGQTYGNIEIIFSDDGTPGFEAGRQKMERYVEANQKGNITNVVFNAIKINGGTVKNMNSAIRLSHGQYIKALAADDMLSRPDALALFVSHMEAHGSKVAFAKMRGITLDGEYRHRLPSCESDYDLLRGYTVRQTRERLFRRNFLPAPAWMIHVDVFREYGLFPECVRLIEDYPYWLHLTANGVAFDYLDEVLVEYRLSGISSAGAYGEAFMQDMFVIYERFIFPFDSRYGCLQPIYNALKRAGLNFYLSEAKRGEMAGFQKLCMRVRYLPFWVFVSMQRKADDILNKCLRGCCGNRKGVCSDGSADNQI